MTTPQFFSASQLAVYAGAIGGDRRRIRGGDRRAGNSPRQYGTPLASGRSITALRWKASKK